MTNKWKSQLEALLVKQYSQQKGEELAGKYGHAFPLHYQDEVSPKAAALDIEYIEKLSTSNPLQLHLYQSKKAKNIYQLKLYQIDHNRTLSAIIHMLENMGLRTVDEQYYKIALTESEELWIRELSLKYKGELDPKKIQTQFQDAFTRIYFKKIESDGFNHLILSAQQTWRDIVILRAYVKYLYQIGFRFNPHYIERTLIHYPNIAADLVQLFKAKFDPTKKAKNLNALAKIEERIILGLNLIASLEEDQILRALLQLIQATIRTNYFQKNGEGNPKEYLSLKFLSQKIPGIPLPAPLYEIFVYSRRFEGIHLRSSKIARGGIRWSERHDFRTEIFDLMKTQIVKNAVIVPSGAKGGFFIKKISSRSTRELIQAEISTCYNYFIRGLLDLTDNLINGKVIHPIDTVCYDEDDTYLVVAADKGTATFSDLANKIAEEYQFWIGDAFASGGAKGYDHKKMGITARGAWESVKRHFHELNINVEETSLTVVGIGDMSGDVFGNGLLYLKNLKLVAAFDHRHIFIDPNPDQLISYAERQRLFNLPYSSWEDYNPKLISAGGGVYSRGLKSIEISAEAKNILGIETTVLTSAELISAILKAPVDLLWNGGIGTYVKSSIEKHVDAGDKSNDLIRINGNQLRCRVVGEGGNLGFTQLGRIEYALKQGLINTDFIDNSGGVDCSDHEVNLKILLNNEVLLGNLNEANRDKLLFSMEGEVAEAVLKDNYDQALAISYITRLSLPDINYYQQYIKELEYQKVLDRSIEKLPDDKQLLERKTSGVGLTKPEISVLISYSKIYLEHEVLNSSLPEDPYFMEALDKSFPSQIRQRFKEAIKRHSLGREIIATKISNAVVNDMGPLFVYRLHLETGATIPEILRGYTAVTQIFQTQSLQSLIDSLGYKIDLNIQYELFQFIKHFIVISTRWFLYGNRLDKELNTIIDYFSKGVKKMWEVVPRLMVGVTKEYLDNITRQFVSVGISEQMAHRIASIRAMYNILNVIEIDSQYGHGLAKTAEMYFEVGSHFNLVWFRDQLSLGKSEEFWDILVRFSLRDELDVIQKTLTLLILKVDMKERSVPKLLLRWMSQNSRLMERWKEILRKLYESASTDHSRFFVALRLLSNVLPAQRISSGEVLKQ